MKLKNFLLLALSLAWLPQAQAGPNPPPKLVVAMVVDQLCYEYFDRFHHLFGEGGVKLLTEQGAFMTAAAYDYAPTSTAPGHASYFSGSSPMLHGIVGNSWYDKRTGKTMYCVEDPEVKGVGASDPEASHGKRSPKNFIGATVADQMRLHWGSKVVAISLKDRGAILPGGKKPHGAYWFEFATGNFITSSYYVDKLPDWVTAFNDRKLAESYIGQTWDRLLDEKEYRTPDDGLGEGSLAGEDKPVFPHKVMKSEKGSYNVIYPTPFGNDILAQFAKAAIEGEKLGQGDRPDLLCVSFSANDACGHRFGPYSQEVQDITLRMDLQFKEFFAFLDRKIGLDNVTIVLTADHAVCPTPEYAQDQGLDGARVVLAEELEKLKEAVAARFGEGDYFVTSKSGAVTLSNGNLFYNHKELQKKKIDPEDLSEVIREWALSSEVYQAVFSRDQLLDGRVHGPVGERVLKGFNGERSGDVVLALKPYHIPSRAGATTGATHGSPHSYDTRVPVTFYGSAFIPGRYADPFNVTDIAATLCAGLGILEPPLNMGKAAVQILK